MTNDFHTVIDRLAQQYHLICVNYDGFDDRMAERPFTDMLTVTKKSLVCSYPVIHRFQWDWPVTSEVACLGPSALRSFARGRQSALRSFATLIIYDFGH